jgi:PAS domain S-box-containing protein
MSNAMPRPHPDPEETRDRQSISWDESRCLEIVRSALDGIITIDCENRITEFNPAAEEIFGHTRQYALGRDLGELVIPPEMRAAHREGLERHRNSTTAPRLGKRLGLVALRANGERFPIELTVSRVGGRSSEHFTAFIRDLTQQRVAEAKAKSLGAELKLSERKLAALLAQLPGMAYQAAPPPGWALDFASPGATVLCGYSPQDLVGGGVKWEELVHDEDRARVSQARSEAVNNHSAYLLTYRIRTASGTQRWVRDQGSVIEDDAGAVVCLEGLVIDLTAESIAQHQIESLNAELEARVKARTSQLLAANEELEAFSYSIAHDLRAPLTTIDGFTRLIQERLKSGPDGSEDRMLARICASVRHMANLTDAMLALAKVGRGHLSAQPVDLASLAREVVAQLSEQEPGRKMEIDIPDQLWVSGDELLLKQVLQNLIGNAWKFSRYAPVTYIRLAGQKGANGTVTVSVHDRGAGFDMQLAKRLFSPFERHHPQREFEGTGVGLAIVQKIVQRHGGEISAVAKPDEGATFSFTLACRD